MWKLVRQVMYDQPQMIGEYEHQLDAIDAMVLDAKARGCQELRFVQLSDSMISLKHKPRHHFRFGASVSDIYILSWESQ